MLSVLATALTVPAVAQFDGPAPLSWRFQASLGQATGSPLIDGETIYYPNGGRLVALDRDTGNKRWQYPQVERIPGVFKGSPIMFNGTIVTAADNKVIYAVDAKGQTKWTYTSTDPIIGQITTSGRYIVFEQSGNKLMALDGATGAPGWDSPYLNGNGIQGGIAANGSDILFFNYRNELVSISVDSRKANWVVSLQSLSPGTSPVVANGSIYINCGNTIVALSADLHRLRWQHILTERLSFSPAVSEDAVYSVSVEGNVFAWDSNGTALTKAPISLNGTLGAVKPYVIGKKAIVPTTNGAINLIDPAAPAGKQIVWSYLMRPSAEYQNATASNGTPGAGAGNISRGSSTVESVVTIPASATPILAGTTLLVPSRDGTLLAFDKYTGVDLTAPKVTMQFPNPGDQVSPASPLQIWLKIEDDASGVDASTLVVEIDGVKMDTKLERDGTAIIKFSATGKNKLLSDGRKDIVVTVSDYLGNVRRQQFALTIDNTLPPVKLPGTTNPAGGFGGPPGQGKGGGGSGAGIGG